MKSFLSIHLFTSCSLLLLSGCSFFDFADDKKPPLTGERVSVLELQRTLEPNDTALKAEGFVAPAAWKNDFWTQPGGYPNHNLQHVSLSNNSLKKIWSSDIGQGGSHRYPLTGRPVVFNNVIFTVDSHSEVMAFDIQKGKKIWGNTLRPKSENDDVIGGGLAVNAGILYATTGYGELISLNTESGGIIWRVKLTSPSRAAPTVIGDKVFVLTLNNHLTAFDSKTGSQLWKYEGIEETVSLINAASPAADNELLICPMSSGELTALRIENGSVVWSDSLSTSVESGGLSSLPDIAALPVMDKGSIFAISYAGKFVSIDQTTGQRIWTRDIGGGKDPWIAGNMIFFISSNSELVALGRDSGTLAWVKPLSSYSSSKSIENSLEWNGPILAGNRLILTSSGEDLVEVSPVDGTLIKKIDLGFHVAVPPVIAGETLYLVSEDGTLSAWK